MGSRNWGLLIITLVVVVPWLAFRSWRMRCEKKSITVFSLLDPFRILGPVVVVFILVVVFLDLRLSSFIDVPSFIFVTGTSFLVTFALSNQILPFMFIAPSDSGARIHYYGTKSEAWALSPVTNIALIFLFLWDDPDPEGALAQTSLFLIAPLYSSAGYLCYLGYGSADSTSLSRCDSWFQRQFRTSTQFALLTVLGLLASSLFIAKSASSADQYLPYWGELGKQIVQGFQTGIYLDVFLGLGALSLFSLLIAGLVVPRPRQMPSICRVLVVLLPTCASVLTLAVLIYQLDYDDSPVELFSFGIGILVGSVVLSSLLQLYARLGRPELKDQEAPPSYRRRPVLSAVWFIGSMGLVTVGYLSWDYPIASLFGSVGILATVLWSNRRRVGLENTISERTAQLSAANDELVQVNADLRREQVLERLRGQAQGMQSSEDIKRVVEALYQGFPEMTGLEAPNLDVGIGINLSDSEAEIWATSEDGRAREPFMVGRSPEEVEAQRRGDHFSHFHVEGEEAKELTRQTIAAGNPRWTGIPEERWAKELDVYRIFFDGGAVGVASENAIPEESLMLIKRFGEVFAFAHSRHKELQTKEAHLREAEAELQTAHDMQMGLMPIAPPLVEGFDVAGRCVTANHVGGDLFQFFQSETSLSIALADVTGKAMDAAFPVVMFSGILDTMMQERFELAELFSKLNHSLHRSLDARTFICFEMAKMDPQAKTVRYSNGGLPYPYHYHQGEVTELQVDTYPLGVRHDTEYEVTDCQLSAGDYLVFCSDGFAEAEMQDGVQFGYVRTAETVRVACSDGVSVDDVIDRLVTAVETFRGDEPQTDDMTCVVVKVLG